MGVVGGATSKSCSKHPLGAVDEQARAGRRGRRHRGGPAARGEGIVAKVHLVEDGAAELVVDEEVGGVGVAAVQTIRGAEGRGGALEVDGRGCGRSSLASKRVEGHRETPYSGSSLASPGRA